LDAAADDGGAADEGGEGEAGGAEEAEAEDSVIDSSVEARLDLSPDRAGSAVISEATDRSVGDDFISSECI
jgi:hypothetical protein